MASHIQDGEIAMNFVRLTVFLASALMFMAAGSSLATEHIDDAPQKAAAKKEDSKKAVAYPEEIKAELAERGLRLGERVGRIRQISISSWDRLDNQHLLLTVGVSKKYLMRLTHRCEGLSDGATLQFSTVGSDVTEQDQIRVTNDGMNRGVCQIDEIRKLEKVEDADAPEEKAGTPGARE